MGVIARDALVVVEKGPGVGLEDIVETVVEHGSHWRVDGNAAEEEGLIVGSDGNSPLSYFGLRALVRVELIESTGSSFDEPKNAETVVIVAAVAVAVADEIVRDFGPEVNVTET